MDFSRVPRWAMWVGALTLLALIGMCTGGKGRRSAATEAAPTVTQDTRRVSFAAEISPLTVSAGESFVITVTITNHDKKPVDNIGIVVRGPWDDMQDKFFESSNVTHKPGFLSGPNLRINKPIPPGQQLVATVKLFTKKPGVHEFKVTLTSGGQGPGLRDENGAMLEDLRGTVRVRSI